eukprot:COSAG03_NODE_11959_length_568_cov_1.816631_2_plen_66_part_01
MPRLQRQLDVCAGLPDYLTGQLLLCRTAEADARAASVAAGLSLSVPLCIAVYLSASLCISLSPSLT